MIYEETPLLSGMQLARESLVGKAMDAKTGRASVTQRMLGKQDVYDPMLAQDIDGNWYVVIKVEDVPRHVPPLDEIRAEVIGAWKFREASKLALEKAEDWAVEVQASSDSFSDFFRGKQLADQSGIEIVTTDLFSWLTYGATPAEMQRGPRLGEAPPLVAVGPDFMTKAFELKEGEVKALQNYDRTQAYVARLHQRQRSEEELRSYSWRKPTVGLVPGMPLPVAGSSSNARFFSNLPNELALNLKRVGVRRDSHLARLLALNRFAVA